MQLLELKSWYARFQDFWSEWKRHKSNGFTEKDLIAIEIFAENNFFINTSRLEMFHELNIIIERLERPLVLKFKESYSDYKEWVINKFQFYLFKNALLFGWDYFFNTPIEKLPLKKVVIKNLLLFKCDTVQEIMSLYGDSEFSKNPIFKSLKEFYLEQDSEQTGWDYFFEIPIETLPITFDLEKMKSSECNTFKDILDKFNRPGFYREDIFKHINKFSGELKNQRILKNNQPIIGKDFFFK